MIQTLGYVFTVIVGGVCIMLFVSTKTLRESRDDFAVRIKQLEEERVRDKATIAEQVTAIGFWRSAATGDAKLDALTELVTSLTALLSEHHGEARLNWVQVNAGLGHLGTSTDQVAESIEHMTASLDLLIALIKDREAEQ